MQRVLMGPAWFLSRCLSQCRQFVGFRLPPKKHDKQAARRIHAQNLQAGAVACGRELGQRVSRPARSVVSLAGAAGAT